MSMWGLPGFHPVYQFVQLVQGEGCPVGAHFDGLIGEGQLVDTIEGLGVGGCVSVDEGVVEFLLYGLGLELDDGGLQVLDVAAAGGDVVVHVGVPAENLEGRCDLVKGGCGLGPRVSDVVEGDGRGGILPVVGEGVAYDFDEGHVLEHGAFVDYRLYNPGQEHVVGQLAGLC